jgi:hypothetical protein
MNNVTPKTSYDPLAVEAPPNLIGWSYLIKSMISKKQKLRYVPDGQQAA